MLCCGTASPEEHNTCQCCADKVVQWMTESVSRKHSMERAHERSMSTNACRRGTGTPRSAAYLTALIPPFLVALNLTGNTILDRHVSAQRPHLDSETQSGRAHTRAHTTTALQRERTTHVHVHVHAKPTRDGMFVPRSERVQPVQLPVRMSKYASRQRSRVMCIRRQDSMANKWSEPVADFCS